ncbi:hypothetical protein GGR54DRAFT_591418 [Hypoxylon sp. NC1633]|nr:hypothetical protein GGR54DRAFT_591418 [Hypoxylon sp. NC1633]
MVIEEELSTEDSVSYVSVTQNVGSGRGAYSNRHKCTIEYAGERLDRRSNNHHPMSRETPALFSRTLWASYAPELCTPCMYADRPWLFESREWDKTYDPRWLYHRTNKAYATRGL